MSNKPSADPPTLWIDSNENRKKKHSDTSLHNWEQQAAMHGFNPVIMSMEVGDFRFMAGGELWVIERKKVPEDLEASFIDGRLNLQYWKMLDAGVERMCILREGNMGELRPDLSQNIRHTLFELQALGVFMHDCKVGETMLALSSLHGWLSLPDHGFFRRPPLPIPGMFTYINKDRRRRVQEGMVWQGITEKTMVEALKRFTLWDIVNKPELLQQVARIPNGVVAGIYRHFQREVPESLIGSGSIKGSKRSKVEEVKEEDMFELKVGSG